MTPGQQKRLDYLRQRFTVDDFDIHFPVPEGSIMALGHNRAGHVAWVEVIEPEPTFRWCYDTGEPQDG